MCDSASAAWLLRQLEPNRTVQVMDIKRKGGFGWEEE